MATAEVTKLDELQREVDAKFAERRRYEKQRAQQIELLETIKARRPQVAKAHAGGDLNAARRLDELDKEARTIARTLEGIDAIIAENVEATAPIEAALNAESRAEGLRRKKVAFDAACLNLKKQRDALEQQYISMCKALTTIHSDLWDIVSEYPEFQAGNFATQISESMNFRVSLINRGWDWSGKYFGSCEGLHVVPLRPTR